MAYHVRRKSASLYYAWDDHGHGSLLPTETLKGAQVLVNQMNDWYAAHPEEHGRCGTCTPVEWFLRTDQERAHYWEAMRRRDAVTATSGPLAPAFAGTLVQCDCGHQVSRALVMTSSSGTSCPDCYDEMGETEPKG